MSNIRISFMEQNDIQQSAKVLSIAMLNNPHHIGVFMGNGEKQRLEIEKMFFELFDNLPGIVFLAKENEKIIGVMRMKSCIGKVVDDPDVVEDEVVESHGCNSQHKVGDRFCFDGAGNLLTQYGPKKICAYALQTFATLIYGASEFIYAGLDPNDLTFKRIGCTDVGVRCGGWGHIDMEIKIENRAVPNR